MSRDSSAKYYQNKNEKLQKISLGKKEKETKATAYLNNTNIYWKGKVKACWVYKKILQNENNALL